MLLRLALVLLISFCSAARASAQRVHIDLRVGAVGSTALVRDSVIRASTLERIIGKNRVVRDETITPATAPMIGAAIGVPLNERSELRLDAAVAFSSLAASSDARDAGSFSVAHGTLSVRYDVRAPLHVRGGFGVVHYGSVKDTFMAEPPTLQPVVELAFGARRALRALEVSGEVFGQAHTFGTPDLRRVGASDGRVIRFGVMLGVRRGGGR